MPPSVASVVPPSGSPADRGSFLRRFLRLAGPYWTSEHKWAVRGLTLALVLLTVVQVFIPVMINLWSARLFDALEQRSMDRLFALVMVLGGILLGAMVVNATHLWVKRRLELGWRKWLTARLLVLWMAEGRQYQVGHMPGENDNPDGRIAEDIRVTTESAVELAHSLFYCILLLISFTQILWTLSGVVSLTLWGVDLAIPGHMVWIALAYALASTTLALLLGRPLVRAVNTRQTYEANFRFGLVHARENAEAIALLHGEADERRRLSALFQGIARAWGRQTVALCNIVMFSSAHSALSTAFPVLVSAPRYIAGSISLGALMQTAQAFQQMAAALSWPIDNLARVAEWRASVERVLGLQDSLDDLRDTIARLDHDTIVVQRTDAPRLAFIDLSVRMPGGGTLVAGVNAEIQPGEWVLISGDPVAALRLFKVVAGLWPWGGGRVELPRDANLFFLPRRPYLMDTIRQSLSYPLQSECFDNLLVRAALRRTGLVHLIPRLDAAETLHRTLSVAEQKRLGFARLLIHRPEWIFIQEATDALDREDEEEMLALLHDEFAGATILTVGFHRVLEDHHQRKLVLERFGGDGALRLREEAVEPSQPAGPSPVPPLVPSAVPPDTASSRPGTSWWTTLFRRKRLRR